MLAYWTWILYLLKEILFHLNFEWYFVVAIFLFNYLQKLFHSFAMFSMREIICFSLYLTVPYFYLLRISPYHLFNYGLFSVVGYVVEILEILESVAYWSKLGPIIPVFSPYQHCLLTSVTATSNELTEFVVSHSSLMFCHIFI
jgi:hypothetical protein